MKNNTGIRNVVFRVILSAILFSIFIKFDSIVQIINTFVEWGWSFSLIILVSVLIRMIFTGIAVLIILPLILGFKSWQNWLPGYLRIDPKIVRARNSSLRDGISIDKSVI